MAGDRITQAAQELLREVFDAPEAAIHFVPTGTAANSCRCRLLTPWLGQGLLVTQDAHIQTSEANAPEFHRRRQAGARGGRRRPDHGRGAGRGALFLHGRDAVHAGQNAALSLTNATEWGTVYSVDEVTALTAIARDQGLSCHMDGARFANALVALGSAPADLILQAGIDVLSLGGTKNGCMGVEAVMIFDPALSDEFEFRRKRAGALVSKHRFLPRSFWPA